MECTLKAAYMQRKKETDLEALDKVIALLESKEVYRKLWGGLPLQLRDFRRCREID